MSLFFLSKKETAHKLLCRIHQKKFFFLGTKMVEILGFLETWMNMKLWRIHKAEVPGIIWLPVVFSKITKYSKILWPFQPYLPWKSSLISSVKIGISCRKSKLIFSVLCRTQLSCLWWSFCIYSRMPWSSFLSHILFKHFSAVAQR